MVKFKRIQEPDKDIVTELLVDIRKPDMKELCMGPEEPYTAVWQSIENSEYCYAVLDREGHLLSLFGIAAGQVYINGELATPIWFLGTNRAYQHTRAMVYYGRQFCERFIHEAGPLCNFIWCGNEPAIRYIQHLGATLLNVVPMGRGGEMFVPFMLKEVKR